jgi:hypothetical protein
MDRYHSEDPDINEDNIKLGLRETIYGLDLSGSG